MGLVGAGNSSAAPARSPSCSRAEVVAATAAVSEAALVYVARHRNLMISLLMIAVQAALTVGDHPRLDALQWPADAISARPFRRPARRSA